MRDGDALAYAPKTLARFASKIRIPVDAEQCWEWIAAKFKSGYGAFHFRGKQWRAHRFALMSSGESLIPGLQVDHTCNNPSCVNPLHLRQVTARENVMAAHSNTTARIGATAEFCKRGHPFVDANVGYTRRGNGRQNRYCKACDRDSSRERYRNLSGYYLRRKENQ